MGCSVSSPLDESDEADGVDSLVLMTVGLVVGSSDGLEVGSCDGLDVGLAVVEVVVVTMVGSAVGS